MASITSTTSLTLDLPPSCIAFCPTEIQYFVVGTYFLHVKEQQGVSANITGPQIVDIGSESNQGHDQKRSGSLSLFRLANDNIENVFTKQTDFAVLDAKWSPHSQAHGSLLAVATSTGLLAFYKLETTCDNIDLSYTGSKSVADSSLLVLSLSWHPEDSQVIGYTLSDGSVNLSEFIGEKPWSDGALVTSSTIYRHELEAWTLAFSPDSSGMLSGGDDIVLQYTHLHDIKDTFVQWQDRKIHQAGIISILPLSSDLAVTGSYDDHVRLISFPAGARKQVLAELNLGGGVWQLKVLTACSVPHGKGHDPKITPSDPTSLAILASCMHAGSRILRLCKGENGDWVFEIIARFEEHQSMNYGSDVHPSNGTVKSIISTSFYDKLLCLWQFDVSSLEDAE